MDLEKLCTDVREIAKKVGNFINKEAEVFDLEAVEYKGYNDLVSYVDKGAEQLLVERLQELLPEAGFLVEEGTVGQEDKEYQWIIDPLDGTTNFTHGLPVYAISIALVKSETIQLGVIYEINQNECFYAWRGGGAWCNEEPIRISGVDTLAEGLYATGFPTKYFEQMPMYMKILDHLMRETHGIRRLGSAAVDLAYVAAGRFEGFFEYGLNPWDVAAGICIVREAGGKVTDFQGNKECLSGAEICAGGKVHGRMLEVIKQYWQSAPEA